MIPPPIKEAKTPIAGSLSGARRVDPIARDATTPQVSMILGQSLEARWAPDWHGDCTWLFQLPTLAVTEPLRRSQRIASIMDRVRTIAATWLASIKKMEK
jgi:hypothetical protein